MAMPLVKALLSIFSCHSLAPITLLISKAILLFRDALPKGAGTSITPCPKTHGRYNLIPKGPWEKDCRPYPRVQTNINGTRQNEHHAASANHLQSRDRFSKDPPRQQRVDPTIAWSLPIWQKW